MKYQLALLTLVCLFAACTPSKNNKLKTYPDKGTGKLISINRADTNYYNQTDFTKDTVTKDGWSIKYLVKDDSTKYSDLYIRWSKLDKTGIFKFESVLQMRFYFIPIIDGENDSYIFLTHGCATDCEGLLLLPKYEPFKQTDIIDVVDYNIPNGKVIYTPESTANTNNWEVSVLDLTSHKEKRVTFINNIPSTGSQIKAHYNKKSVEVFTNMIDKTTGKKMIETHVVRFD